jgi:hypothetical protein
MAVLFVNSVDRVVGATLTADEFSTINQFLSSQEGQAAILELFARLISQLSVDRRRKTIDRLQKRINSASDAQLDEFERTITLRG